MSEVRADLGFHPTPVKSDFDEWYQHYPRKVARGAAEKAFPKARKIALLAELIAGAQRYAALVASKEKTYVKHPATWLNGKCWLDEEPIPQRVPAGQEWMDMARRRCGLIAKGINVYRLERRELALGLKEKIITQEQALRWGFKPEPILKRGE